VHFTLAGEDPGAAATRADRVRAPCLTSIEATARYLLGIL